MVDNMGDEGPDAEPARQPLRYPESEHPFHAGLAQRNQRFADQREEFLLGYGYNTARAYWGDLEDIKDWAEGRGFKVLELTEAQFKQYLARMKRRGYSPNTIRRRACTWRLFGADVLIGSDHPDREA